MTRFAVNADFAPAPARSRPGSAIGLVLCALSLGCVHHREREPERQPVRKEEPGAAEKAAGGSEPSAVEDPFDEILTKGKKLYSQGDEELIIRHFFRDRKGGFFLDVGCYHYQDMSTTYYLEKHLGWSGIGIDALPYLEADYKKYRPRTKFFNFMVTDHSGTTETFYASGALSSASSEWAGDILDPKQDKKKIEVRTITLNELLDMNRVSSIDFLSMDIEGGEPSALKAFDIERFRPELVCIEIGTTPYEKLVNGYFERHGYRRIDKYLKYDFTNRYYTPVQGR